MKKEDIIKAFEGKGHQIHRETTPYGELLISEAFVSPGEDPEVAPVEFPYGAYVQYWTHVDSKATAYGQSIFDAMHDIHMPLGSRQTARTAKSLEKAYEWMSAAIESGLVTK